MAERGEVNRNSGKVDFILLMTIIVLLLFGLIMLFSASTPRALNEGNIYSIIIKQASMSVVGCVFMFFTTQLDYHIYKKYARIIFWVALALMVLVPMVGFVSHGARRQISLGPISFQPSEVAKFALVIFYSARYTNSKTSDLSKPNKNMAVSIAVMCAFVGCCILQSHLSAAVVLAAISVMYMIAAGLPMKYLAAVGAVGVVGFTYFAVSESYRLDRFKALFNPEAYSRGIGWQILQSLYAVGSGGFFGLGLGQSRQKYLYLPEAHNDYIYAIVCEELGFVGALAVIALFVLLLWRGYKIASKCPDKFSSLVVYGLTTKVALQTAMNIAVVTNSMPNTGISLPFFSSGGTALMLQIFEMGIILSMSRYSYVKK